MCDNDTELVVLGSDLHRHLVASGFYEFETGERFEQLLSYDEPKYHYIIRSVVKSLLNFFVPRHDCNMFIVHSVLNSQLLLEEDLIYLENLLPASTSKKYMKWLVGAAVLGPTFFLLNIPKYRIRHIAYFGSAMITIRSSIELMRKLYEQWLIAWLLRCVKDYSLVYRKAVALVQEWEVMTTSLTLLRDTTSLTSKMSGIDDLKSDLVTCLRVCITVVCEASQEIWAVQNGPTTGSHTMCSNIRNTDVMISEENSLGNIKKLHYILLLVQSDYLKSIATSFMPSDKTTHSVYASTCCNKVSFVAKNVRKCTKQIQTKYKEVKCYNPKFSDQERSEKCVPVRNRMTRRSNDLSDIRMTTESIAVSLEAMTIEALQLQQMIEQHANNKNSITFYDKLQQALTSLQTDLLSTQKAVEIASKQIINIKSSKYGTIAPAIKSLDECTVQTKCRVRACSETETPMHDEIFELYIRDVEDDMMFVKERDSRLVMHEDRGNFVADTDVSRKLLRELKHALTGRQKEMMKREENARIAKTLGPNIATDITDSGVSVLTTQNILSCSANSLDTESENVQSDSSKITIEQTVTTGAYQCFKSENNGSPSDKSSSMKLSVKDELEYEKYLTEVEKMTDSLSTTAGDVIQERNLEFDDFFNGEDDVEGINDDASMLTGSSVNAANFSVNTVPSDLTINTFSTISNQSSQLRRDICTTTTDDEIFSDSPDNELYQVVQSNHRSSDGEQHYSEPTESKVDNQTCDLVSKEIITTDNDSEKHDSEPTESKVDNETCDLVPKEIITTDNDSEKHYSEPTESKVDNQTCDLVLKEIITTNNDSEKHYSEPTESKLDNETCDLVLKEIITTANDEDIKENKLDDGSTKTEQSTELKIIKLNDESEKLVSFIKDEHHINNATDDNLSLEGGGRSNRSSRHAPRINSSKHSSDSDFSDEDSVAAASHLLPNFKKVRPRRVKKYPKTNLKHKYQYDPNSEENKDKVRPNMNYAQEATAKMKELNLVLEDVTFGDPCVESE